MTMGYDLVSLWTNKVLIHTPEKITKSVHSCPRFAKGEYRGFSPYLFTG